MSWENQQSDPTRLTPLGWCWEVDGASFDVTLSRAPRHADLVFADAHSIGHRLAIQRNDSQSERWLHMLKILRAISPVGTLLVLAAAYPPQAQLPQVNPIHVEIDGLRNDKGQVLCALFSSAIDFPKRTNKAVDHARSDISHGHAFCDFSGIASGTYAVSVFHDENSNGKLDTNLMGIPREGVGASNNAKGHFGPPKFEAAAFRFSGDRVVLKITINYL
jgi:uncharacterized protein (DUF2141 family)